MAPSKFRLLQLTFSASTPSYRKPHSTHVALIGQPLDALDTPQLLLDLDVIDANLRRLFTATRERGVHLRTHFKSLKCGGLARYIARQGGTTFLCAKLNEAEVLADAGITDILIANQIVGPAKMPRASPPSPSASSCAFASMIPPTSTS